MEPVCKPIANRWQIPFASSRGYGTVTLQHHAATLIASSQRAGQYPLVLFISDLDPSGLDLERAWQDTLRDSGVYDDFLRIGLTVEQVRRMTCNASASA